jgi:VWFA-related protein
MTRFFTLVVLGGMLALSQGGAIVTVAARGQEPQEPPQVTFQVEVSYVDVDAIVTDEKGNFVSGLTREDFEVFEDGKPQKLEMFSYVELPIEPPDRFGASGRPVSVDTRSNRRRFDGRVYVLVLDDLDISPLRTALVKTAAREFVERHLSANDLAAVVYTSGRSDATQDFTSDRQLLLAAIDKFIGRRLRSSAAEILERHYQNELTRGLGENLHADPAASAIKDARAGGGIRDPEREQRALAVLDTLKNLGEFLSSVRGRRKAVLLFSEGVEMPMSELYGSIHTPTDVVGAIRDAVTAAARSNVNFFALDPRGLIGMTSEYIELAGSGAPEVATGAFGVLNVHQGLLTEMRVSQDSLRTLAEETGGFAAVNQNLLGTAFERIVDANSRYYVLGYYPPSSARDGRFHRIEVRVKRPGLRVSARRGYAAPRGRTPSERKRDAEARRRREARRGTDNVTSTELREALDTPLQQSGLSFSVQAAPFRHNQKEASIALAIDIDGDRFQFVSKDNGAAFANNLELTFFGINQDGRAQRATRTELNLALRPESHQRVKTHGLRVNPRITLEPGRYQVRVGAREIVAGQIGTVFYDLQVPDFRKDPLMLSGLLLSSSAQTSMAALPDPAAPKSLPAPATSRRTFSQSETLTVFAEIYDNGSRQQARQIDTVVTLLSEGGQEVFSSTDLIANPSTALGWTAYGWTTGIPLKELPPGRYLLKLEAKVRGNSAPATRETIVTVR